MTGTIAVAPRGPRMDAVARRLRQLLDSANPEDRALLDGLVQEANDIKGSVDGLSAKIPTV